MSSSTISPRHVVVGFTCLALLVVCFTTFHQLQRVPTELHNSASCEGLAAVASDAWDRYLVLVRDSLTGVLLETPTLHAKLHSKVSELKQEPFNAAMRHRGRDWPLYGYSMAGTLRLDNVRALLERALQEGVPGDFVECGVWRGGASIYARAVLKVHGVTDRKVHLVDSFQGLPVNTTAKDHQDWARMSFLMVSEQQVRNNFLRYNLLDSQVEFHKGYFRYALPAWRSADPSAPIAVLRMDGDMYESTMDQLYNLYDAVPMGGFIIIDDYYAVAACQVAMKEFFDRHKISAKLEEIDGEGVYFRKNHATLLDREWYIKFNASRTTHDLAAAESGAGSAVAVSS